MIIYIIVGEISELERQLFGKSLTVTSTEANTALIKKPLGNIIKEKLFYNLEPLRTSFYTCIW